MQTNRQHQLLAFIRRRLQETGVAPTYDEMCAALGVRSRSSVHRMVRALEERGLIRRLPYRARALEVVGQSEIDRLRARIAALEADLEEASRPSGSGAFASAR